ncbi:hypothetical protein GCM10028778_26460 [Barrientosiimonas marina]|uniref:YfhD family protein n=1 Tax=Lentibacillus kimchii TaxID=1542911 RepID=A0ABW2UU59_9BACI
MGRDEHKTNRRGRPRLDQTPEYAKTNGNDVEFFEEFADSDDKEAQVRRQAAEERSNKR